jgi:hypothetical protein
MGTMTDQTDVEASLREVVRTIAQIDDELTIYVAPEWSPDSRATIEREPEGGGLPPRAASSGMRYFLEVSVAKEVLEGLKDLDLEGRTERLIRYAVTDA